MRAGNNNANMMHSYVSAAQRGRTWLWFIPIVILILLVILFFAFIGKDPTVVNNATLNKPFPQFKLTELLTEKPVSNADLPKGVFIVNTWASWCSTCKAEHAKLMSIKDEKVKIIGVNYKDEAQDAMAYLSTKGNPYTWVAYDNDGTLGLDLGVSGTPETYLVDQKGIIRMHYIGQIDDAAWNDLFKPCMQRLVKGNGDVTCYTN